MTNREKYAEQIIDMALDNHSVAVNRKGEVVRCSCIKCVECIGENQFISCREKIKEWAEQEYAEPTVDWSKVPVDTKILVRDSEDEPWLKRHFARYESNRVYAWKGGTTSHSSDGYNDVIDWKYVKPAEEDMKYIVNIVRANESTIQKLVEIGALYVDETGIHDGAPGVYSDNKKSTHDR